MGNEEMGKWDEGTLQQTADVLLLHAVNVHLCTH